MSHGLQGGAPSQLPGLLSHGPSGSAPPVQGPCLSTSVSPLWNGVQSPALPCTIASPVPLCPLDTPRRGGYSSSVHAGSPSAQATACTVLATLHKPPRGCPSKTQCSAKNLALLGRGPARGHRAAPKTRARGPDPAQGRQAAGDRRTPLYPKNRRTPRTAFCKDDPQEGGQQPCTRPGQAPEELARS